MQKSVKKQDWILLWCLFTAARSANAIAKHEYTLHWFIHVVQFWKRLYFKWFSLSYWNIFSAAEPAIGLFISFYFVLEPSPEESLLQWIVETFLTNELMQRNHNSVQLKAPNYRGYYIWAVNSYWQIYSQLYLSNK